MPLNVKSAKPPTGTVPAPEANGAPMGVGGFASNGSFHCRTTVLLLPGLAVNWTFCAMSTAPFAAKLWKPPAYKAAVHAREVQIRARPRSRAARNDLDLRESYACVAGRFPAEEKYDTPFATTSSTACATMPSWKNGSAR